MTTTGSDEAPSQGWQGLKLYWRNDLIAALSVALVALPLALGISVAAGAPPMAGLISVIVGALVTTFIRGSHVAINGPANALIVVSITATQNLGGDANAFGYVMAAFVVSGVIQILLGLLRLGKLGNIVPSGAIQGMLAAIGLIILTSQIHYALGVEAANGSALAVISEIPAYLLNLNPFIFALALIGLLILVYYPKVSNRFVHLIPAPMWVLFVTIPLYYLFSPAAVSLGVEAWYLKASDLVSVPDNLTEGLVFPDFSKIDEPAFWLMVFLITVVLSLESLISAKAVDKLDPYKRKTSLNKDLVGIGVASVVSAFLGGLPVTTVIARSSVNINHGAKTSWSNFMHGIILLVFVVAFAGFMQMIPLAALAAILIFTGYKLVSPKVFRGVLRQGWEQLLIMAVTMLAILSISLISGLFIGILFTLVLHYYRSGMTLPLFLRYLRSPFCKVVQEKKNTYMFKLKGVVNFVNILKLQSRMDALQKDSDIIMDFSHVRLVDYTVLEYLHEYAAKYNRNGGEFHFTGLDVHKTSSHHPYSLHVLETPSPRKTRLTRRQTELRQLATGKDWEYQPEIEWDVSALQSFVFFKSKPIEYQKNLIRGQNDKLNLRWEICDIALKNAFIAFENYRLTVEVLHLPFTLPQFSLEEESITDRMSLIADQKDIDIEEYKGFSRKFLLLGQDEEAIRKLFTPEIIRFFERGEIYHLESSGDKLLIFRHLRLASPREIVKMVSYSEQLFKNLRDVQLQLSS